jgi:hypothetical protein
MMNALAAMRLMRLCFGVALLWSIFYISFRGYLLDRLRQKLFAIRDELFDFAADGGIGFGEPVYRELRNDLNGLILFAHKMTFLRLLFGEMLTAPDATTKAMEAWVKRVREMPDPIARGKLLTARERALQEAVLYIVRRSVVLHLALWCAQFAALWLDAVYRLYRSLWRFGETLEAQARSEYQEAA